MRQIGRELMGELDEVQPCRGWRLQLLRHICGLLTDSVNVMGIQRKTAYLNSASRQGHKAENCTQQRCFATTALACDANKLARLYGKVEVAEKLAVAKGERSIEEREDREDPPPGGPPPRDPPPALPVREGVVTIDIGMISHNRMDVNSC